MIILKSQSEIAKMRASGRVVARALREMFEAIVPGKTTPLDLDGIAARIVAEAGGTPSFLNYKGFPNSACISVNEVVVHGIPTDIPLQEGDIVSLDMGVYLDGWHADSAWTYPVGTITPEAQRLLNVTRESLYQGIGKAKPGNRIGDIAAAVQKYVEQNGYSVVRDLVGHGIGRNLHEEPHNVPNYGKAGKGELLKEGLTICIEPMVNQGTHRVETLPDKWTLVTADRKLAAHFEHTIAVTKSGPEILTLE
jgi:methionyl aminopeptidase